MPRPIVLSPLSLPDEMPGRTGPTVLHKQWIGVPPHIAEKVGDPTRAWEMLQVKQAHVVMRLEQFTRPGPQPAGTIRIVCVSDTHGARPRCPVPDGDVLIHAGDFSKTGRLEEVSEFCAWLRSLPHARKLVIAGNHDLSLDRESIAETSRRFGLRPGPGGLDQMCDEAQAMLECCCEYLCDSGTIVRGLRVWGSPWQPWFCDWAFNLPRGKPCRERWSLIPTETDVLITHGPPLGHGDMTSGGARAGCLDLLDEVQGRVRPQLHVFGHIHEHHGVSTDGTTTFANASTCDLDYRPLQAPLVFDLPARDAGGGELVPADAVGSD